MSTINFSSVARVEKILVVDDTVDNLFLLQMVLEAEGYQVEVVDSGRAALAKIEVEPPDLVLLDVMMPEMNGYEVVRRIRQKSDLRFLPILMITGCDQAIESNGFSLETDGYIRKPVDLDELIDRVRATLAKKASNTEAKSNWQLVNSI